MAEIVRVWRQNKKLEFSSIQLPFCSLLFSKISSLVSYKTCRDVVSLIVLRFACLNCSSCSGVHCNPSVALHMLYAPRVRFVIDIYRDLRFSSLPDGGFFSTTSRNTYIILRTCMTKKTQQSPQPRSDIIWSSVPWSLQEPLVKTAMDKQSAVSTQLSWMIMTWVISYNTLWHFLLWLSCHALHDLPTVQND